MRKMFIILGAPILAGEKSRYSGMQFNSLNENNSDMSIRSREKYNVNFAYTSIYKNSPIPYCQRLLNHHDEARQEEERGGGEENERKPKGNHDLYKFPKGRHARKKAP